MEKTMKARVQHKHDTEANWLKATNFIPLVSEIIVYDPDENYDYPRIKIGDGKTNINTLPFVTKDYAKISDIPTKPADIGAQPAGNYLTSIPSEYVTENELNNKGYLTNYIETDPTVPAWAKADTKPTYTASEVGALPSTTKIPGALSDLSEDTTHRVVTDAEKEAWNAKSNFSGSYNDLSDKPAIPSIAGLASTTYVDETVKNKVDKDGNKVLSTNDYTTAEKNKLAVIAPGAQVNVNADWNATGGDAQILNKPTLGTMAAKNSVAKSDLVSEVQTSLGKADTALQPNDISDWAKQTTKPEYGADEIILDTTDWENSEPSDTSGLKLDDFLEALREEINIDHVNSSAHISSQGNPHGVTKTQVGLDKVDNVKQYSASNPPPYPVISVNGQTGAVTLDASVVGALPNTTTIPSALSDLSTDTKHRVVTDAEKESWNAKANISNIPTKVSQLQNDSKFLTSFTEADPTVPAWAKQSTKPSYTASEVGADVSGTAAAAVEAHNTATDAHADIRAEIAEVNAKIVSEVMTITQAQYDSMTQTQLSSLYAQGVRIIAIDVSSSDNSGNVATYTNQMPISIGTDKKVYNGTGWKGGIRLSASSGVERDQVNSGATGFIPVKSNNVIRFKDGGAKQQLLWNEVGSSTGNCAIVYYDTSFAWLGALTIQPAYYGICGTGATPSCPVPSGSTADGGVVSCTVPTNASIAYARICMSTVPSNGSAMADIIVTINEEIV